MTEKKRNKLHAICEDPMITELSFKERALAELLADSELQDLDSALQAVSDAYSCCGSLPEVQVELSLCYHKVKRAYLEKRKEFLKYEVDGRD